MQRTEHCRYLVLDFDSFEADIVAQSHLKEKSTLDLEFSLCNGRETGMCLIGSRPLAVNVRRIRRPGTEALHDTPA
jgi:hypothetical protein